MYKNIDFLQEIVFFRGILSTTSERNCLSSLEILVLPLPRRKKNTRTKKRVIVRMRRSPENFLAAIFAIVSFSHRWTEKWGVRHAITMMKRPIECNSTPYHLTTNLCRRKRILRKKRPQNRDVLVVLKCWSSLLLLLLFHVFDALLVAFLYNGWHSI